MTISVRDRVSRIPGMMRYTITEDGRKAGYAEYWPRNGHAVICFTRLGTRTGGVASAGLTDPSLIRELVRRLVRDAHEDFTAGKIHWRG